MAIEVSLLEVDTDQALVKAGRRLVVVADHTKWGTIGIRTIAQLHEADMVITDEGLNDATRTVLESYVREVRVVPVIHSAEEF
ncbi:MAG TPA: hypothetical protein VFY84_11030 [Jiangellales bacterium]|nr:hypothetical protein [Jiangellales bacterium]